MVTAEIAVALPALVVLLAVALTACAVVAGQLRCVDAAREGARAAARGESVVGASLARAAAPAGAQVSIGGSGAQVRVEVRATIRPVGGLLPGFAVAGTAVALREPGPP